MASYLRPALERMWKASRYRGSRPLERWGQPFLALIEELFSALHAFSTPPAAAVTGSEALSRLGILGLIRLSPCLSGTMAHRFQLLQQEASSQMHMDWE